LEKVGAPKILLRQKHSEHQQTNDHSGQANLIFPYGSAPELVKVLNVDTNTQFYAAPGGGGAYNYNQVAMPAQQHLTAGCQ
jgi:hypothetical protein